MEETTPTNIIKTETKYEITVEKVVRNVETGERQYRLSETIYQQIVDKIDLPIITKLVNDYNKND
jgi:hypothetical protein